MMNLRELLVSVAIVLLSVSCTVAPSKQTGEPTQVNESFQAVESEYNLAIEAMRAERAAAQAAGKERDKGSAGKKRTSPSVRFSPRFLAIAEKDPDGPEAIRALKMAFKTSDAPGNATRAKILKLIRSHYLVTPSMIDIIPMLGATEDDECHALIAEAIARSPDRTVQAAAYQQQISHWEQIASFAETMKKPHLRKLMEGIRGKDGVKERIAKAERAPAELDKLKSTFRERFGDLFPDLSVGQLAPEVHLETVDGKPASLRALKGKVVVLDIWTTWCPPCNAMIPHEREMVERLKDKPFALVSISIDEKKQTLVDFLATEKMPWTHWWGGPSSAEAQASFATEWQVRSLPTIYVLDAQGVIRYTDLRGEALEKAVNTLLAEPLAPGKAAAAE